MPATIECPPTEQTTRRDSAFYSSSEDNGSQDMERISIKRDHVTSRSAEQLRRRESVDSGAGEMETVPHSSPIHFQAPGISTAFKRTGSGSSIRRSKGSELNLSEQTHLLLQKMAVLEQKLISMDSKLKEEQLQRLTLEAKVIKLEEANEKLKDTRGMAHSQLKDFADKFYAMDSGSPVPSPHPSVSELRFRSRTDSVSSSGSSRSSKVSSSFRLSGISI